MTTSDRGDATKDRIIEAALETVTELGFANTTSRAVAEHGDFNPALIFYHFGSVDDLLLAAFARVAERQVIKYREAMESVASFSDLVSVARRLHDDDMQSGAITAVTQLMAAADEERATVVLDRFDAWISLVQDSMAKLDIPPPVAAMLPAREVAYSVAALFLGIELMSRLDPARSEAPQIFDMLDGAARALEALTPFLGALEGLDLSEFVPPTATEPTSTPPAEEPDA